MLKPIFSLRFQIPILTIVIVISVLIIAYLISSKIAIKTIIEEEKQRVYDRLNFIQNGAEQLLRVEQDDSLQQLISSFASEPDVKDIVIVDTELKVLASLQYSDLGRPWDPSSHNISSERIARSINNNISMVYLDKKLWEINGLARVCNLRFSDQLRPFRCGLLFYKLDMGFHLDSISETLSNQILIIGGGVGLTALLIMVFVHKFITRRTTMITDKVEEFEAGNRDSRLSVRGNDEIALLSKRLNHMFDTINENRRTILDREKRLSNILDTAIDPIITIDSRGRIESFNSAAEIIFGYKKDEIIGQNINILMPQEYAIYHDTYINNYISTGTAKVIGKTREVVARKKDGSTFPVELSISQYDVDGQIHFTGIVRDVSERRALQDALIKANENLLESNAELTDYALQDSLTGLANRRQFDHTLYNELQRAQRQNSSLLLMLCDIDYFKKYNDAYGHQKGDDALGKVGEILRETFQRSSDLPARYGGEEFAIILPGLSISEGLAIAEKLQYSLKQQAIPHSGSEASGHITLSIGIASLHLEYDTPREQAAVLIKHADKALYEAKSAGRNCIRIYKPEH